MIYIEESSLDITYQIQIYNIYNFSLDLYFNRDTGILNILRKVLKVVDTEVKYIIISNLNLYHLY